MRMETFDKIASFLAGDCSSQEKKELEAWRKEAPSNEEEFCKLKKIWDAATPPAQFRPDVACAWQKVQTCIHQKEGLTTMAKQPIPLYLRSWAIAAAVAFLFLGSAVFIFTKQQAVTFSQTSAMATLETKANQKQELLLSDGTHVWLNQNSKILYPENFDGSLREIKLEGEGYFEVAHMPEKPFVIQAGAGKVQVLGTAFNLEAKEEVKIQVSEGRVRFSADEKDPKTSLILEAGEAAILRGKNLQKEIQDPNFLAWRTGAFIFEDTNLKEVFKALEKYYPVKISSSSSAILNCRLFARFQQQPLEEVLKVLGLTLNLDYEYNPKNSQVTFRSLEKENNCSTVGQ